MSPTTIPEWVPSVPRAGDLNTQGTIATTRANVPKRSQAVPLAYGAFQTPWLPSVVEYDDGTWTVLGLIAVGELEAIDGVWMNGAAPPAGVSFNTYTGTTSQGVDPLLQAARPSWSSNLVYSDGAGNQVGMAYLVVQYTDDDFSGRPSIVIEGRGRKVFNPATALVEYSTTPALCLADVLTDPINGRGESVDNASLLALAATNDESVGGVPRRQLGLVLDSRQETDAWVETLRGYAACWVNKRGAVWHFTPDRPRAVDLVATADDVDQQQLLRLGRADEIDVPTQVVIEFTDTTPDIWQPREYTYPESLPAGTPRRISEVRLPGVHRYAQAVREAQERYNKLRVESRTVEWHGYDEQIAREAGDVVQLSHPIGLTNQLLRITRSPRERAPGLWQLQCAAYDASVYSDAAPVDPGDISAGSFLGRAPETISALPYIALEQGTAIKTGVPTLVLRARRGVQNITTGSIQLYVGNTLVTQANGYGAGSNGYVAFIEAPDITDSLVVKLKDGPFGVEYDSQTLVDLTDGIGSNGENAVVGILSNQSHPVAADADGTGYVLSAAGGLFQVWDGQSEVTGAAVTYSVEGGSTKNGLTLSINSSGIYSLSGSNWSSLAETFTLRASYSGRQIDIDYRIVKMPRGFDGANLVNLMPFGYGQFDALTSADISQSLGGFQTIESIAGSGYIGSNYVRLEGSGGGAGFYTTPQAGGLGPLVGRLAPNRRYVMVAWIRSFSGTRSFNIQLLTNPDGTTTNQTLHNPTTSFRNIGSAWTRVAFGFDLTASPDTFFAVRIYSTALAASEVAFVDGCGLFDLTPYPLLNESNALEVLPSYIPVAEGGPQGPATLSVTLSNEAVSIPAASNGTGYNLTPATGVVVALFGTLNVTAAATLSVVGGTTKNGLSISLNSSTGVYVFSGGSWSTDTENFTVRTVHEGQTVDKVITLTKARRGVDGAGGGSDVLLEETFASQMQLYDPGLSPSGTSSASIQLDGKIFKGLLKLGVPNSTSHSYQWSRNSVSPADYQVRLSPTNGGPTNGGTATGDAFNTWHDMNQALSWGNTISWSGQVSSIIAGDIEVRRKSDNVIVGTDDFSIQVGAF